MKSLLIQVENPELRKQASRDPMALKSADDNCRAGRRRGR
jgi:hypothetical protein